MQVGGNARLRRKPLVALESVAKVASFALALVGSHQVDAFRLLVATVQCSVAAFVDVATTLEFFPRRRRRRLALSSVRRQFWSGLFVVVDGRRLPEARPTFALIAAGQVDAVARSRVAIVQLSAGALVDVVTEASVSRETRRATTLEHRAERERPLVYFLLAGQRIVGAQQTNCRRVTIGEASAQRTKVKAPTVSAAVVAQPDLLLQFAVDLRTNQRLARPARVSAPTTSGGVRQRSERKVEAQIDGRRALDPELQIRLPAAARALVPRLS